MTTMTDVIADMGRPVKLRFSASSGIKEASLPVKMDMQDALDILQATNAQGHAGNCSSVFQYSNRLGVSGTLHRVSAFKDGYGLRGLTYRIGRHITGVADAISDILAKVAERGQTNGSVGSLLIIAPPGAGKTTLLRDVTRQLADTFGKAVMVVDPSAEIAGGGLVPHACIGNARCMVGSPHQSKHELLLEAVSNHGPEVIVCDEVGSSKDVSALKDISQRGVKLVTTVHGSSLQCVLGNPVLNPLPGGKQHVVIGDAAARGNRGCKTKAEQLTAPLFSCVIEVEDRAAWRMHPNVSRSVDAVLQAPVTETRRSM